LYAVAYPVLDSVGCAIAALTVPYAERIDQLQRKSIATIEEILGAAAHSLTSRLGGKSHPLTRPRAG
jgi:DNA-binding IclR family transcriptional regulator